VDPLELVILSLASLFGVGGGSVIGAWPGVRIRERLGEAVLQRAFGAYLVVVAVLIVVDVATGA